MVGTLVNAGAVITGSLVGMAIHSRLPQKYIDIVFQGIGLFTLAIGISMSLQAENMVLIIVSIVGGSILGRALGITEGADRMAEKLKKLLGRKKRASDSTARFNEGFITATMLFCVGSMSILGAIEDGTGQTPTLLYTKSIMDGVSSVALAASFGLAITLSVVPMFLYQGALTLFAAVLIRYVNEIVMADLTAVGGILLIGLGINILKIKEIRIMDMLPALVLVVVLSYFFA